MVSRRSYTQSCNLNRNYMSARVIYLVEEQDNPSTDYFVLPVVMATGLNVIRCGFKDLPTQEDLESALIVFVRYVPDGWARLVSSVSGSLAGIVFFMDDDVLDLRASSGMPLRYRFKLARLSAIKKSWLIKNNAQLWVSTEYLKNKYSKWKPKLVVPTPISGGDKDFCKVFYHATSSHRAEMHWLYPVVVEVLARDENIIFELVGDGDIRRFYRGLTRVNVVHPMKWPNYNAFLETAMWDIGLVPILDVPFNLARSYTKFFDITRCGAAGIYSSSSSCSEIIEDGVDGLILGMDEEHWVDAILRLAGDGELRKRMIENAGIKLDKLSAEASANNQKIIELDG